MDRFANFIAWFLVDIRLYENDLKAFAGETKISKRLTADEVKNLQKYLRLESARKWCELLALTHTIDYIDRVESTLKGGIVTYSDALTMLTQLGDRLITELKQRWQLHIPPEFVELYRKPSAGWGDDVLKRFPSAAYDIAECGRCLACGRSTAAVFHAMRVLEVGISALAVRLGVPDKRRNKSWPAVLNAIQDQIDLKYPSKGITNPRRAKRREYSQMVSHFNTFQKAWRDYTVHTPVRYDVAEATSIIYGVRAFFSAIAVAGVREKTARPRGAS